MSNTHQFAAHQFTAGDFGTCRTCGAGQRDLIHWGIHRRSLDVEQLQTVVADAQPILTSDVRHAWTGNLEAHPALPYMAPEPVRTDDVLEARNAALLDMLAAVLHGTKGHRSLIDRGGFMTPDRQQLLDQAEALVVEIRG